MSIICFANITCNSFDNVYEDYHLQLFHSFDDLHCVITEHESEYKLSFNNEMILLFYINLLQSSFLEKQQMNKFIDKQ